MSQETTQSSTSSAAKFTQALAEIHEKRDECYVKKLLQNDRSHRKNTTTRAVKELKTLKIITHEKSYRKIDNMRIFGLSLRMRLKDDSTRQQTTDGE